jgi:hypothetical protein
VIITNKVSGMMEHRLGVIQKALSSGACTAKEIAAVTGWEIRMTQRYLRQFVSSGALVEIPRSRISSHWTPAVYRTKECTDTQKSPATKVTQEPMPKMTQESLSYAKSDAGASSKSPATKVTHELACTSPASSNSNSVAVTLYIDSSSTGESHSLLHSESRDNGNTPVSQERLLSDAGGVVPDFTDKALSSGSASPVAGAPVSSHVPKSTVKVLLCLADECDNPRTAGGYCESHKALAEPSTANGNRSIPALGNVPAKGITVHPEPSDEFRASPEVREMRRRLDAEEAARRRYTDDGKLLCFEDDCMTIASTCSKFCLFHAPVPEGLCACCRVHTVPVPRKRCAECADCDCLIPCKLADGFVEQARQAQKERDERRKARLAKAAGGTA